MMMILRGNVTHIDTLFDLGWQKTPSDPDPDPLPFVSTSDVRAPFTRITTASKSYILNHVMQEIEV
jgi:hypothetical protein